MRLLGQRDREDFVCDASSRLASGEARGERDRRGEEVEREAFVDSWHEGRRDDLSGVVAVPRWSAGRRGTHRPERFLRVRRTRFAGHLVGERGDHAMAV
jgi:hypothetical protein